MDALPEGLPELLDLFAHSLAEIRFGDLDGAVLTAAASEVTAAANAVALAERALESAHASLDTAHEVLLRQANRALAYARVFAEGDEALLARVNAIALPRGRAAARKAAAQAAHGLAGTGADAAPAPRPRGRPRKTTGENDLPLALTGE
jgi:hypothetical protein